MRFVSKSGGERRPSLNRRLIGLVLAAVGTGVVVSASISAWQQSVQFADGRRELLQATAQVFSAAAASAAWERSPSGALSAIRAIGNLPDIRYAEVQAADGTALARLGSAPRLIGDFNADDGSSVFGMFLSRTVQVSAPIVHGGRPAGRLILIGGTAGLWERLIETVAVSALGGLMAIVVGLLVAWRLQHGIARPLRQLMSAMAEIREHHRYDVTVADAGDREVGQLVDGFKAMLGDIHERDAKLDAHRRNLEHEVAERTRDLREARDAAQQADRAKSEFLATMSHEIRTPMNGMMVMAELLVNADMPRRQRRYAEVIASSGQSLLAIINDILDFSKIESGKLDLESVPVDLAQLAETVVSLFAERAHAKGIDLAALVDPAAPRRIAGDPVRLTQIVSNLVNNALKFTDGGYVQLLIAPAGEPNQLRIAVSDTGIGIPAGKIDSIFEAFSQADQSTTRQFGGTGLGLAICKKLAVAMGGRFEVSSEVGRGSTFAMIVPVRDAQETRPWPRLDTKDLVFCVIDLDGEATAAAATRYFSAFGTMALRADGMSADDYASAALLCVDAGKLTSPGSGARNPNQKIFAVARLGDDDLADRLIGDGRADAVLTKPLLRTEIEELLVRLAAGLPLQTARETPNRQIAMPRFPGLRVLVADDTMLNREVAVEALAQLGVAADTVENGAQAIEAVHDRNFDVVLMDGSMPEIDGFTAARDIRRWETSEGRRRLPIVALTAHVVGAGANAWRDAGMDGVVYKPFTLQQLADCLGKLFPTWSAQDASDAGAVAVAPANTSPESARPGEAKLLDAKVLQDLQAMAARANPGFLRRIFDLYLENAPLAHLEISKAALMNEWEACARAAHALKSMSYNVGALAVAASADAIERSSRQDTPACSAEHIDELRELIDETLAKIAELRAQACGDDAAAAPTSPPGRRQAV